jgi:pimeloyl-ACP methyl ester carboxylesterase
MPRKKIQPRPAPASAFEQLWSSLRTQSTPPPAVPGRWLLVAGSLAILASAVCAWGALCLLFWQGSWQLLYHPASAVTRTPASAALAFDSVGFATSEAGESRLKGWWIPSAPDARYSRFTVLYLHGQDGNLGDTVDILAALHEAGVNVLAFDYRGYGQSQFARPSEAHWREDTESALQYLTGTRHVVSSTIILDGRDLGANLALEIAARHPELAGVVLESPLASPVSVIFNDPRARLVPAHLLVRDRFDADTPAAALRIPSLWFLQTSSIAQAGSTPKPDAFQKVSAPTTLVWLTPSSDANKDLANGLSRWLDAWPHPATARAPAVNR